MHRYLRPLFQCIQHEEIDPAFIISHRLPLDAAPEAYDMFFKKHDECLKVMLTPAG